MRRVVVVGTALVLSGCSWMPFFGPDEPRLVSRGDDIAGLINDLPDLEVPKAVASRPTREEVMEAYNRVYGLLPDPGQDHAVLRRVCRRNQIVVSCREGRLRISPHFYNTIEELDRLVDVLASATK